MRTSLILIFVAMCAVAQETPPRDPRRVTALPAACSVGQTVFLTTGTTGTYECRTTNTWSRVADGGAASTAISATTAGNLSGTPALPDGVTATTQAPGDATGKLATDAFVAALGATKAGLGANTFTGNQTINTTFVGVGTEDSDALNGGGTDNTVAMNTALAAGSATVPVSLDLRGISLHTGIRIPAGGNVRIRGNGLATGFYTASASNTYAISNATPNTIPQWNIFDPGNGQPSYLVGALPTLSNQGSVTLENFWINGNRGTVNGCTGVVDCTLSSSYQFGGTGSEKGYQTDGPPGTISVGAGAFPAHVQGQIRKITNGSTSSDCTTRAGAFVVFCYDTGTVWSALGAIQWYTAVDLFNLKYININRVKIYNSPSYGIRLSNVDDVIIQGVTCEQSTYPGNSNHDCIHVDGPAKRVTLRDIRCTNIDDDCVAFNQPEGWGSGQQIADVALYGLTLDNVFIGFNSFGNVARQLVSGVTGTYTQSIFRLLSSGNGTISLSNVRATKTGTVSFPDVIQAQSGGTTRRIAASDVAVVGNSTQGVVMMHMMTSSTRINEVDFRNVKIEAGHAGNIFFCSDTGTTIDKFILSDVGVMNATGNAFTYTLIGNSNTCGGGTGTITELAVNSIDTTYLAACVTDAAWTGITKVSGNGVQAMSATVPNCQVPDAKMVNGYAYYSATDGALSMKLPTATVNGTDGAVKKYTLAELRQWQEGQQRVLLAKAGR